MLLLLLQALRVSVGKLGIIARLQLKIVKEIPVKRTLTALTPVEFVRIMKDAQAMWEKEGKYPGWMNETQIFWVPQKNQVSGCLHHTHHVYPGCLEQMACFSCAVWLPEKCRVPLCHAVFYYHGRHHYRV